MKRIIVGLVGPLGSGKTTVSDHLVSLGYRSLRFSQIIDQEIAKKGLERSRKIQQDIGDQFREKFGPGHIGNLLVEEVKKDKKHKGFVVEGFRNPAEVAPFRVLENFVLVGLTADPKVRFERLTARGQERDPQSWEDFQKQESRDQGIGQPEHGQQVLSSLELADFVVDTDKSKEQVYNKVNKVIEEAKNEFERKTSGRPKDCDFC